MPQPTIYERSFDFTDFQDQFPNQPLPASPIDANLDEISSSIGQTVNRLALIQRDDGQLKNQLVTIDSLSNNVRALLGSDLNPRGEWVTLTVYAKMDLVTFSGATYICVIDHTSGASFAVDRDAGKWSIFSNPVVDAGSSFFQKFSGTGAQTDFTLSNDLGVDENAIMVFYNNGGGTGRQIMAPTAYTLNGTSLQITPAPVLGTDNIYVFAPSLLLGAASTAAAEAVAAAAAADADAVQTAADRVQTGLDVIAAGNQAANLSGTSVTSNAIAVGSKSFTTQTAKSFTVGRHLLITSDSDPTNKRMAGVVTAYNSGTGALTVLVESVVGNTTHTDWTIRVDGERGALGHGPGLNYTYSSTTTNADPTAGRFRLNNGTHASATALYISETDGDAASVSAVLATWDDGTSTIRGYLKIYKADNAAIYRVYSISGTLTDSGTWDTFTIAHVGSAGSLADGDVCNLVFTPKGDLGNTGSTGPAGGTALTINTQTGSYTLVLGDAGNMVAMNVAGANNLTVPLNSTVAFPVGTQIVLEQTGAGQTTVVATGGVTINKPSTRALKARAQWSMLVLIKKATDTWTLGGDMESV